MLEVVKELCKPVSEPICRLRRTLPEMNVCLCILIARRRVVKRDPLPVLKIDGPAFRYLCRKQVKGQSSGKDSATHAVQVLAYVYVLLFITVLELAK